MDRDKSRRKWISVICGAVCLLFCAGMGAAWAAGRAAERPPDGEEQTKTKGEEQTKEELPQQAAVRIACDAGGGNGVILWAKEGEYVLATAAHVTGREPENVAVGGIPVCDPEYYVSAEYDLAFVKFRLPDSESAPLLLAANIDEAGYDALEDGDEIRVFGFLGQEGRWYEGRVLSRWIYMEDFGYHMLWGEMKQMQGGLSGSGVYDKEGRLVGILCGGGGEDEIAVLTMNIIAAQWQRAALSE